MQQNEFPIEILIGEDLSLDNTRNIADRYQREYPHSIRIITASHNVGMTKNWERLVAASKGEFLAICEGDDYWIDSFKLQKQVDFLQANGDYGLCYTEIDRLHVATNSLEKDAFKNKLGLHPNTFSDFIVNAWYLAQCTWVLKADMIKDLNTYLKGPVGLQLLLTISSQSKIKFFNESTAVYRILNESASHFKSPVDAYCFRKDVLNIQCWYASAYNVNMDIKTEIMVKYYIESFINICKFDNKVALKEAYTFLKTKNKVNINIYICYFMTKCKILPIALWLYGSLKNVVIENTDITK